jgi:catechol 2,3-dioxygenase-like lactoylglutathione lyase family enzyme
MTIGICRIDHVNVTVPASVEEQSKDFYGRVLGLEEIPKPEESRARGGAWYRHGALQVHVSIEDDPASANARSRRHVCYVVRSLSGAEAALRAAGIEIVADPHPQSGWPRFYVRDPGGNRIEIAQASPDTGPDTSRASP